MERKRIRRGFGMIPGPRIALALALLAAPALAGCASSLNSAREAWDDGEGTFEDAEEWYLEAIAQGGAEAEIAKEELHDLNLLLAQDLHKTKAKEAEKHYRNALELNEDSEGAREGLAKLLMSQYRFDEALAIAQDGAKRGTCTGCRRLVAVMMIQRGDARYTQGDYAGAEADYAAGMAVIPDANVTLGLARARIALQNLPGATEALASCVEVIGRDDMVQREQFLELRRAAVLLALDANEVELADKLLDMAPIGVSSTEQLGLAIEVSMRFSAMGKPDEALSRMQALVAAADAGKLAVNETRKEELRDTVADLLGARALQRLGEGDKLSADEDIAEALELRPNNSNVRLLKVLMIAGEGKIAEARTELKKVADEAKGKVEVRSILYAMDVETYLAAGRLKDAATSLDYAKRGGEELPEVHVAAAQILAKTPVTGPKKSELADLKKKGRVKYPGGSVVKAGEALSELAWADNARKAAPEGWPFRGPGLDKRMSEVRESLAYYPYAVEFNKEATTIVVFENKGTADVKVTATAKWFNGKATVPAGGKAEIVVQRPIVVEIQYGETTLPFLAEPYTKVTIPL
jgi:tetratricopeptide (TPR) repeat protein